MQNYTAEDIEVLSGLDPVRRRPGMYTDTTRPNHLAQEVIDNSVDEALAGYATQITISLFKDGSIEIEDDGRGMPVDIHPEENMPGITLIMTKLHSGGKFSSKNYQYSGGLHGVGISVVNALSTKLEVWVKRDGAEHYMSFENGDVASELTELRTIGKRNSGTRIRFNPNEKYFDTIKLAIPKLTQLLRAKAVLCPGLHIRFINEYTDEKQEWCYQEGLQQYLLDHVEMLEHIPNDPFMGDMKGEKEGVTWVVLWLPTNNPPITESYVNLVPTIQGGTHVSGFRTGLLEALREFCEFRNLIPRGVKLTPDDIWDSCSYVISIKLQEPQFSGQTKERLTSRQCASFVAGVIKDAFSLWLNQHTDWGEQIAELVIQNAQKRIRTSKKITRKKIVSGPALPGKLADCTNQGDRSSELFLVEGDSAGGSAKQARDKEYQAIMPLRGKILNTWEVDSNQVLASQEVHDIAVALGIEPGSSDLSKLRYDKICVLADADSDGAHIATLLCALFLQHFKELVAAGHVYIAMPPLYRIDVGKEVYYALDEEERQSTIDRVTAEKKPGKISVTRFKGLGEMDPMQLRVTTMQPDTRRLVQLTIEEEETSTKMLDMLLSKKRASDRKHWLETKGNLAVGA